MGRGAEGEMLIERKSAEGKGEQILGCEDASRLVATFAPSKKKAYSTVAATLLPPIKKTSVWAHMYCMAVLAGVSPQPACLLVHLFHESNSMTTGVGD